MTPLVITPEVEVATELILSDGATELDLMGNPPWGLYLVEFTPPIVGRENTMALAPEGQRRVRSRPVNAVGSMRLRVDRADDSSALFHTEIAALEAMVESAHKRKGTIEFLPPNLERVWFDIESIQITDAPADGPRMSQRLQEFVVEFEVKPYGRLEPVDAWASPRTLTGPIDGTEIDATDVEGSVDALAELVLTDSSSESADFVEFAIGQQGYDPDAPLRLVEDDLILGGFAGTQPGGAGSQVVAELTDTPIACCGTGALTHAGSQKIATLIRTEEEDVWLRLAWKINDGAFAYGRWVEIPPTSGLQELTLAVIDLGDAGRWDGQIEAFQGSGDGTLYVREVLIIPAEVCGRIRRPPEATAGTEYVVKEPFTAPTAGDLNGQTSTVGGLWSAPTDFDVDATANYVTRTSDSDASSKLARLASDLGALDATVTTSYEYTPDPVAMDLDLAHGLVVRYADASNYAALFLAHGISGSGGIHVLIFRLRVAGTDTDISVANGAWGTIGVSHSLRLSVDGAGVWAAYADGARLMGGQDDELATGGALDSGKAGLFSYNTGSSDGTGIWTALNVLSTSEDHALWADASVKFTSEGAERENESAGRFARTRLDGDTLRIPASTAAALPSLLVVRRRMHDIDSGLTSDGRSSDLTATLEITPRVSLY